MSGRARDTTALGAGSLVTGLLAYVFFALSTRSLGASAAAPVSVLWTYWSFAAAALTFPLQHWIARSVATHQGEGAVQRALPGVALVVALIAGLAGLVSYLAREPLFHRGDVWFPLLVGAVTLGSGLMGVVRGGLSARRHFVSVAWALVAENAARCAGALLLVLVQVRAAVGYGICLAAGSLMALLWPSATRFAAGGEPSVESPLRFLGGAAGGQLTAQVVLTGGPIVLALGGGSAAQVTALFAALALFRAPYILAIGVVSQLTGKLTALVVQGRQAALRRVRLTLIGCSGVGVVAAAGVGGLAGPWLVRLVFGADVAIGPFPAMLVAVGSALALANLVWAVMILAQDRSGAVARAWAVASVCGVAMLLLPSTEPLTRTCWAFAVAEAAAFSALLVSQVRGQQAQRRPKAPGR
ncbi:MAG: hypothetical protein M3529_07830 [Actinomycetota bacterium]|nr:hypothetical protein [Actinomycetota bacterium]